MRMGEGGGWGRGEGGSLWMVQGTDTQTNRNEDTKNEQKLGMQCNFKSVHSAWI